MNSPAKWREKEFNHWQYYAPGYAVYADVRKIKNELDKDVFSYNVRCMFGFEVDGNFPSGRAKDLESAKRIVEAICSGTNTCEKLNPTDPERQSSELECIKNELDQYTKEVKAILDYCGRYTIRASEGDLASLAITTVKMKDLLDKHEKETEKL